MSDVAVAWRPNATATLRHAVYAGAERTVCGQPVLRGVARVLGFLPNCRSCEKEVAKVPAVEPETENTPTLPSEAWPTREEWAWDCGDRLMGVPCLHVVASREVAGAMAGKRGGRVVHRLITEWREVPNA